MATTAPTAPAFTESWPANRIARFLTLCGAPVDLISVQFTTRYTVQGRPYVGDEPREVEGFTWVCGGCGTTSVIGHDVNYLPNECDKARNDANDHAAGCRSVPHPTC